MTAVHRRRGVRVTAFRQQRPWTPADDAVLLDALEQRDGWQWLPALADQLRPYPRGRLVATDHATPTGEVGIDTADTRRLAGPQPAQGSTMPRFMAPMRASARRFSAALRSRTACRKPSTDGRLDAS